MNKDGKVVAALKSVGIIINPIDGYAIYAARLGGPFAEKIEQEEADRLKSYGFIKIVIEPKGRFVFKEIWYLPGICKADGRLKYVRDLTTYVSRREQFEGMVTFLQSQSFAGVIEAVDSYNE